MIERHYLTRLEEIQNVKNETTSAFECRKKNYFVIVF